MKIGIVIAIVKELKAFLESGFEVDIIKHHNYEVYHCKVKDNDIYAVKSGCGLIDASCATQMLISAFDCKTILNFGVTGALDRNLKVEDLFLVTKCVNHDYDLSPIDKLAINQYEEFDDIYIPLDSKLIELTKGLFPTIKEAICSSGDQFVEDKELKEKYHLNGCNICDMEIASIARVCYLNSIPCLSIKCISDTFDGDGSDFEKNVTLSASKAFNLMKEILFRL